MMMHRVLLTVDATLLVDESFEEVSYDLSSFVHS